MTETKPSEEAGKTSEKKVKKKVKKASKKETPTIPSEERIYKKEQFQVFLDLLRGESAYHWNQIANAIGVDPDTITAWKKHPSAQKAIRDGIERALEGMTKAGKDDWRMWESKLKILGLSQVERIDHTTKGKELPTPIYAGKKATKIPD